MATETRQQILTEAREVFLKEGLARFSMRAVAERVGLSATALYRHFDDKDALLASLLGEAFATFGSYLGRALSGKTALERLHLAGLAYVDFALDHPRDYELMFLTNCQELGYKRIFKETDERSRGTFEFLVERVEDCMKSKVFTRRDAREAALYAWSTLHGIVSLWLYGQLKEAMDERAFRAQAELTLELIEKGLGAGEAPRRR
jgi:AcrR family transcriptional regulator